MRRFLKYTLPSILAMWVFALYTMIDGYFVANYVGEVEFAAVNISMPVLTSLFAFGILFSIGTLTKVGHKLGAEDAEGANLYFSTGFMALIVVGLVYTVLLALSLEHFMPFLGAEGETLPQVRVYLKTIIPFSLFFMLSYQLEVLVKVDGFPRYSALAVLAAALSNLGLDYLFIVHFQLGIFGAALATGIAQVLSSSLLLSHFLRRRGELRLIPKFRLHCLVKILPLGLGDALSELSIGYTVFIFNATLLALGGQEAVIIYTTISYISIFTQVTMSGVAQGLAPLLSYDYGREDSRRLRRNILRGFSFVAAIAVFFILLARHMGSQIVGLFLERDSHLFPHALEALSTFAWAYLPLGFNVLMITLLASLGQGKYASILSLVRTPIMITLVMVAVVSVRPSAVWSVLALAEFLSLMLGLTFLWSLKRRQGASRASSRTQAGS